MLTRTRLAFFASTTFAAATFALAATSAIAQPQVRIDGSSTVFPVTEAVAEEFQKANKGKVRVTVGVSGTGGGFRKFCSGETDVQNASRPITRAEMELCRKNGIDYVEMPIAYDALSVVVNPKNTWLKQITVAELRAIWEPAATGKITRWNQVNPAWPDQPMALFGAGTDSGTFDYFTEAINGKSKASRTDFTASEDDNVLVQGVSRNVNGMGFFGFAYYWENRKSVRSVPVVAAGTSTGVAPSPESVIGGTYTPLSRPIFIYVSAAALKRPEVREFAEYYNVHATKLVTEVKYVPLPPVAYKFNLTSLAKPVLGTKFGGENKVGMTIEQLMKLEAVR
jgi:phosphate transport system substrate-binding protein